MEIGSLTDSPHSPARQTSESTVTATTRAAIDALKYLENTPVQQERLEESFFWLRLAAFQQGSHVFASLIGKNYIVKSVPTSDIMTSPLSVAAAIITTVCNEAWGKLARPNETPHKQYLQEHPPNALRNCITTLKAHFPWLREQPDSQKRLWMKDAFWVLSLWERMLEGAETQYEVLPRSIQAGWETNPLTWQHSAEKRIRKARDQVEKIQGVITALDSRLGKGMKANQCGLMAYARLNLAAAQRRLMREQRIAKQKKESLATKKRLHATLEGVEKVKPWFPELAYIAARAKGHHSYFLAPICYPCIADLCFALPSLVEDRPGSRKERILRSRRRATRTEELFFLINGHQENTCRPENKRKRARKAVVDKAFANPVNSIPAPPPPTRR